MLVKEFEAPGVVAIVLMGSYARGDPGTYSDIDLLRLVDQSVPAEKYSSLPWEGSHIIEGVLVVVYTRGPAHVEEWFSQPEIASSIIAGLRTARGLVDRQGNFAAIQERARGFVWDEAMQEKANAWASEEMVGWIEEARKGLEGLRMLSMLGDDSQKGAFLGRMLNARFGLSWGLTQVLRVQRGVLITSDNTFYNQVIESVGVDSRWAKLSRTAFGIGAGSGLEGKPPHLPDQVKAGLHLYIETTRLLEDTLLPGDEEMIRQTVYQIKEFLGNPGG
jgi:hypothetical protein